MDPLQAFRLDDRVVIVTGATSGLGVGFARAVTSVGGLVVLAGRREKRLEEVARELADGGAQVRARPTDVADPDACAALVDFAVAEFGHVDGLVNNAGVGEARPAVQETAEQFRQVIDVNLNGVFWMAQACAKLMPPGSSIVNVASVLGLIAPRFPQASYAASKAGVLGLTRDLAQQWSRRRRIRVNALCPGYFLTEMTEAGADQLLDNVERNSMLGRFGAQDELDPALIYLLSGASSYVTGTAMVVDGGMAALLSKHLWRITVDFTLSPKAAELAAALEDFMRDLVYPAESVYREQMRAAGTAHYQPPVLEELKDQARARGLWNLFLPHKTEWTDGLSNVDYAPLAEITGRSFIAPEVLNCSAPDTGNMELLTLFGTGAQKERWLRPLLDGTIRSAFLMTEPAVASSDATNVQTRIEHDGGDWVINGRKWWISGTGDPRCRLGIVMGKTDPAAASHLQQSMVLVPLDSPGMQVVRDLTVFGYNDREGHCEIVLDNVRVPADSLLGRVGGGFAMSQARLGPGRIHHCMRSIGAAERALELMCLRARDRVAFGGPLADKGVVQEAIANSRIEIDQARLLTLHAAWVMDTAGNRAARGAISAIKVAVPLMASRVIDRAIQVHGGAGLSQDFPLAQAYALQRYLRLADGPDEVHRAVVAKLELRTYDGR